MAMKLKISKGDTVQVITGSDKGKKGQVLAIDSKTLKIKVQGVKMMTHFDKKEKRRIRRIEELKLKDLNDYGDE